MKRWFITRCTLGLWAIILAYWSLVGWLKGGHGMHLTVAQYLFAWPILLAFGIHQDLKFERHLKKIEDDATARFAPDTSPYRGGRPLIVPPAARARRPVLRTLWRKLRVMWGHQTKGRIQKPRCACCNTRLDESWKPRRCDSPTVRSYAPIRCPRGCSCRYG